MSEPDPLRLGDPARMAALRRTALLDSPAEESFDRLTRLAARVVGAPVALVSLVDQDRQFFKSQCGLPEPWASQRETPLSHSFCQHVVATAEPLVIEDAREHPLVRDNLAIRDLNVIAYLGIPLVISGGEQLGSFCVIDTRPRRWTADEIALVRDLAGAAVTEIEMRLEIAARREAEQSRAALLEELSAQRTRLLNVFMEAPALIAVHRGPEHVIQMANPRFLRMVGDREVVGKPVREAFPELEGQGFFQLLDQVYQTGEPFAGNEYPARWDRNGDGTLVEGYFNFVYQPVYESGESPEGVLVHAVEVTEQVLARHQVEALAAQRDAILRQIADGVIVTDGRGRIIFVNEAARRIHGVAVDADIDRYSEAYGLFRLDGTPYPSSELPLARAVLERETVVDAEWLIRRADGTEVVAQGSAAPVVDEAGEFLGAVLTLRDVTAQRALERQRRELVQARDRFFAAVSHDLRTPINAILGYGGLLLDGIYGELGEEQRSALERSQHAASDLLGLVNDVLDLSKLEAGKVEVQLEPTDLGAVLQEAVATVGPLAEQRQTRVDLADGAGIPTLVTDPRRVRQILLNLLSNAVKYGDGKPVRVECRERDGAVEVRVEDQGPGIPPESLPRIFEDFVQLETSQGGTGLGLPIARRLAALLGGELRVESRPGVGSTFSLVLPRTLEQG